MSLQPRKAGVDRWLKYFGHSRNGEAMADVAGGGATTTHITTDPKSQVSRALSRLRRRKKGLKGAGHSKRRSPRKSRVRRRRSGATKKGKKSRKQRIKRRGPPKKSRKRADYF